MPADSQRILRWLFRGRVQGVGFRPSAYRLATALRLGGFVRNTPDGAEIVLAGPPAAVDTFVRDFLSTLPPAAEPIPSTPTDFVPDAPLLEPFAILPSSATDSDRPAPVLPDLAVCPDCLREMRDPANRRYRYPFITCSHCGPRASIITALPYDRPSTTMAAFPLCPACAAEYSDPADRRFHAQPIACPDCGPRLEFLPSPRLGLPPPPRPILREDALSAALAVLRADRILALKGIGGYHLLALATSDAAVHELRRRKRRPDKPLAVLFPSLDAIHAYCHVSPAEAAWLTSPAAPIVLLRRFFQNAPPAPYPRLSPLLAPHLDTLGAFLPYAPLHWLLLDALRLPVVATSANVTDEPLVTDDDDALARLPALADAFLLHNRPIAAPYDDSVLLVDTDQKPVFLRRARGLAPYSLPAPKDLPAGLLAAGPASKSTVALSLPDRTIAVSAHIGDLANPHAIARWQATADELPAIHRTPLAAIAVDLHPDYPSTRAARAIAAKAGNLPVHPVQHHHAHLLAAVLEHRLAYPVIGFALDGTGLAPDRQSIWGFQALLLESPTAYRPVATLRPFPLPGPDAAAHRPLHTAYALCHAYRIPFPAPLQADLPDAQQNLLRSLADAGGPLAPSCTSAGRLFDAAAALLRLARAPTAEAIPAMRLQTAAALALDDLRAKNAPLPAPYPFPLIPAENADAPCQLDPAPLLAELAALTPTLPDLDAAAPETLPAPATWLPALRFHLAIAHALLAVAEQHPKDIPIVLGGGCFQNPVLLDLVQTLFRAPGRPPYALHILPPSDAGLAPASLLALP